MKSYIILLYGLSLCLCSSGCGTYVPQIGEIWDDNTGTSAGDLERLIKQKIYCELQAAVNDVNTPDLPDPYRTKNWYQRDKAGNYELVQPLPDDWGVQMSLQLIVEEDSSINPGISFINPLKAQTIFGSPVSQTFSIGAGGSLSATATRTDKFSMYYLIPDFKGETNCVGKPVGKIPADSLLLQSDLGIEKWLRNALNVRGETGVSRNNQQLESLSYDVKFEVVSSAYGLPGWKLAKVTTGNGGLNLLTTKRDRTHEMTLTFGPSQTSNGKAQPNPIALNSALAQDIGTAVGTAVTSVLLAPP